MTCPTPPFSGSAAIRPGAVGRRLRGESMETGRGDCDGARGQRDPDSGSSLPSGGAGRSTAAIHVGVLIADAGKSNVGRRCDIVSFLFPGGLGRHETPSPSPLFIPSSSLFPSLFFSSSLPPPFSPSFSFFPHPSNFRPSHIRLTGFPCQSCSRILASTVRHTP